MAAELRSRFHRICMVNSSMHNNVFDTGWTNDLWYEKLWASKLHSVLGCVGMQALLTKRVGVRLIVIAMTTLANVSQELAKIASSSLDFYRVDDLRSSDALAEQLARDICGRLRLFILHDFIIIIIIIIVKFVPSYSVYYWKTTGALRCQLTYYTNYPLSLSVNHRPLIFIQLCLVPGFCLGCTFFLKKVDDLF